MLFLVLVFLSCHFLFCRSCFFFVFFLLPNMLAFNVIKVIPFNRIFSVVTALSLSNLVLVKLKLNPLRARWPMEPALISAFCSLRWRYLTPPGWTLIQHRLAPSRRWYAFTYPGTMESRVSLGEKGGHTNIQILAETGSNLGPCDRKADILQLRQLCPVMLV